MGCLDQVKHTMMKTFMTLCFLWLSQFSFAQTRYTISGTIRTRGSGENIIHASVMVAGQTTGVTSNAYGFFSLTLPEGDYSLVISSVGMKTQTIPVALKDNTNLDVQLEEGSAQLREVVVTGGKDRKLSGTQMGLERLTMSSMHDIPVLMGEKDVLKTIQLLPGVIPAGDGNTGFYVRGGASDQNLILLDGATVYNPAHLLGFFSTFNSDAVKDVSLYKGFMPPSFGGRLSSVVDVTMNDGNNQALHGNLDLGVIAVSGELEGPIDKGKSSFLVAGRTTSINTVLRLSGDSTIDKDNIGFYDLNAKLNFSMGNKDHLYASGYMGRDNLGVHDEFGLKWGNEIGSLRWNHVFGRRLFSNTTFSVSNYDTWTTVYNNASSYEVDSRLNDYAFKQEWDWFAGPSHTIKFGLNSIYHVIEPGVLKAGAGSGLDDTTYETRRGWENAVFAGDDWKLGGGLTVSYGLRLTDFGVFGPGNFYNVDGMGNVTDTMHSRPGQQVVHYLAAEPRLAVGYQIDNFQTVKFSYGRNTQNVHLLANSATSLPTDRWALTNNNIKPEIVDQWSVGYYRESQDHMYSWSAETYYKQMQHQIDYRDGANLELTDIVETELLYGKGRAYGIEGQLKKNKGKLTGWVSYTLSKSQLQIDGINGGHWYDATQDRTNSVDVVGIYHFNPKWTFSADWVYYTGNPVSYPSGKYTAGERVVYYYAERNGYRMPAYHRLDLSATMQLKKKKLYSQELQFSIYNAYDRMNAYFINFRQDPSNPDQTQAVRTSLFGIVPAISYNIKF